MRYEQMLAAVCLAVFMSGKWQFVQAFSFSEEEAKEQKQERATKEEAKRLVSGPCKSSLKQRKIAVIIGEQQSEGRVRSRGVKNYGPHFSIINDKLRGLGLRTYSQEEISRRIAQAEVEAALNNDPDSAVSAARRLGADFVLRGVIQSRSHLNTAVNTKEVFVDMSFSLSDASGRMVANAEAGGDSWAGTDTLAVSLDIVKEKADLVVGQLYSQFCRRQ